MKINKKMFYLKVGDTILRENQGDFIIIKKEYDPHHGCYECEEWETDGEGNEILLEKDYSVTPYDLVGGELLR